MRIRVSFQPLSQTLRERLLFLTLFVLILVTSRSTQPHVANTIDQQKMKDRLGTIVRSKEGSAHHHISPSEMLIYSPAEKW
jgi:hypothetical protein